MVRAKFLSSRRRLALKCIWIVRISAALVFGTSLLCTSCGPTKSGSGAAIYPGVEWETVSPAEKGIDPVILAGIDSVMQAAHSNGILIVDGKVVKEWSHDRPSEEKIEVQSITKTMVSLLLGIAIKEGKIAAIDDKVVDYYPAFEVGPHTKDITFKHLVTISSGIEAKKHGSRYLNPGNMPPGVDARYHNDHFDELARALTYIYQQPLIEVLRERVLSKIGGTVEWGTDDEVVLEDGTKIPVNAGYAFSKWEPADLARIGWLFLNDGYWQGKEIVPSRYAAASRTPLDIPVMTQRNGEAVRDTNSTYGYGWRGSFVNYKRDILWFMSGNGGQMCVVIPEKRIVFVKINGYGQRHSPFRGIGLLKERLLNLTPDRQ